MEVSGNTVKQAKRFVHWTSEGESYRQGVLESLNSSDSEASGPNVLRRIKNVGRAAGKYALSLAVKIPEFYSRERFVSSLLKDDAGVRSRVHSAGPATDALWEDLVVTDESTAEELDVERGSVVSNVDLAQHIAGSNA